MDDLFKKAKALLDRMHFRSEDVKLSEYEAFIKNEIKPPHVPVDLTIQDLTEIHGNACQVSTKVSYGEEVNGTRICQDTQLLQSFCYVQAVLAKLRSKGLISADIRIGDDSDRRKKNSV